MRHQQGLTLVELLITLVIMGLLVGVVMPGFQNMVARNGLTTSVNALTLAISYARSEAVREGGGVRLRADTAGSLDWAPGFQVLSGDGTLLREFEGVDGNLTLVANVSEITFTSMGAVGATVPAGLAPVFDLCLAGDSGFRVSIGATGRSGNEDLDDTECP